MRHNIIREIPKKFAGKKFKFYIFWKFDFKNTRKWSKLYLKVGSHIPKLHIKMYRGENAFSTLVAITPKAHWCAFYIFIIYLYACYVICMLKLFNLNIYIFLLSGMNHYKVWKVMMYILALDYDCLTHSLYTIHI